jgi:hypothetical protein
MKSKNKPLIQQWKIGEIFAKGMQVDINGHTNNPFKMTLTLQSPRIFLGKVFKKYALKQTNQSPLFKMMSKLISYI